MSIACTICGCWYQSPGRDTLDICTPCFTQNFAGAQPPLDWAAPRVSETITLSPRDVQALVRYRIHRQAVLGTGPCTPLVREDD